MTVTATTREPDSIGGLLAEAGQRLAPLHDSHRLDAELLLAHVMGCSRSHLYAWPRQKVDPHQRRQFASLIERRATGTPVAYLLGRRDFWSLTLEVGPPTLIPRPETELLVELALAQLPPTEPCGVLDLGTGSGAIALALASERPGWRVTAVEACAEALAIARRNCEGLALGNVTLLAGNWYEPVAGLRFELIVSNPPYVKRDDPHLRQGDVRHEPVGALDGGPDGLESLRAVIARAPAHLTSAGLLIVEHGADQAEAVAGFLSDAGLTSIETHRDLAGLPRASSARRAAQSTPTKLDNSPP